jgi:Kef-type K+ transport system membrane component KefB
MDIFTEISLILAVSLVVSAIMRLLKQPLIIGYIFTGLLVGPYFLGILRSTEVIELFSQLGITALLFVIGLGLSPKVIKELGLVSLVTGMGQVIFTSLFGYLIGLLLGFTPIQSIYIAIALTFSSTIIILKLLSDKGDVHKLYGRIAIGFLLVQDLVATIILVAISSFANASGSSVVGDVLMLLVKGLLILIALFLISTFLLPKLTNFIAKSPEFLFIFSLSWGMGIGALYHKLGLSVEIGALVAGVTLSMTPYSHEIASRLKPLRDFFIILFFILLGYHMMFDNWQALLLPVVIFSVFILIGNPLIVVVLMNLLGYNKRIGLLAGLTVAQISEFSLILITLGYSVGHLSREILSMVTLVGIITISGSTYMILYSGKLYKKISKYLTYLEFRKSGKGKQMKEVDYDALLFGYRRVGMEFAHAFNKNNSKYLVVDFNPETIAKLSKNGIDCEYGDAEDVDFLLELPVSTAHIIVSTIPDYETNLLIVQTVRHLNKKAIVIIISDTLDQADFLYSAGADHVIMPHYIGAKFASEMIVQNKYDRSKYAQDRRSHIEYLTGLRALSLDATT